MNQIVTFTALLIAALVAGGCVSARFPVSPEPKLVSISEARAMDTGECVRVSGVVTVQSGAFSSSISSGFAIQDESAGIYVVDDRNRFKLGEKVEVIGRRDVEFKQANLKLLSARKLLASPDPVEPRTVKTGEARENVDGSLIRAVGRIVEVEDDGKFGYKVWIDDGSGKYQVFINRSTALSRATSEWECGQTIDVIGFAGRFEEVYEIMPRRSSDMKQRRAHGGAQAAGAQLPTRRRPHSK